MCDINNIMHPPKANLYKEPVIMSLFLFLLVYHAALVFPATIVVQDIFDEFIKFILEFYLTGWQTVCIYAFMKIPRFAWYSCIVVLVEAFVFLISRFSHPIKT